MAERHFVRRWAITQLTVSYTDLYEYESEVIREFPQFPIFPRLGEVPNIALQPLWPAR